MGSWSPAQIRVFARILASIAGPRSASDRHSARILPIATSYLALMVLYEPRLALVVVAGGALYAVVFLAARPLQAERYAEHLNAEIKQATELVQMP